MQNSQKHYLCDIEDLKTQVSTGIEISGTRYILVEKDGNIFAYINECPHLKTPLDWNNNVFLDADGDLIQCATHGALFTIENGECIYGPCLGEHLTPIKTHIVDKKVYLS